MPPSKCAPLSPAVHDITKWGSSRSPELQGFQIRLEALHPLLCSSAHFHRTLVLTPLDKPALSGPRSRVPAKGSHLMLYYTVTDGTFRSLRFQLCTRRDGDSKQRPHSYVARNVSSETRGIGSRQSVWADGGSVLMSRGGDEALPAGSGILVARDCVKSPIW